MPFYSTPLKDVWVFEPKLLHDERGYFFESFNLRNFEAATGLAPVFVQDNQSLSYYGVMRGMHFQKTPFAQAKLLRVLQGEVQDVVVDVRKDSPTFGQHFSIVLSAENKKQLFIPKGFAHGFLVLSDEAEFFYKCDDFYSPGYEASLLYNDPSLGIEWLVPEKDIITSDKDKVASLLTDLEL
jgi:dTDP-4-dehydrorhamnose 3,5-epimerase